MDPRFENIYRRLYDEFVTTFDIRREDWYLRRGGFYAPELNVAQLVRDEIERAIGHVVPDKRVRVDARHFLLVNFSEMIALPLAARPKAVDLVELRSDIRADIEAIFRDVSSRVGEGEISGGDILQSVAAKYSEFRVSQFRLWN